MVAILRSNFGSSGIFIREVKMGKSKSQFRVEVINRKLDRKAGGYWNKNSPTAGSTHWRTNSIKKPCLKLFDDAVIWLKYVVLGDKKESLWWWQKRVTTKFWVLSFLLRGYEQNPMLFHAFPLVLWTGVQNGGMKRSGEGRGTKVRERASLFTVVHESIRRLP